MGNNYRTPLRRVALSRGARTVRGGQHAQRSQPTTMVKYGFLSALRRKWCRVATTQRPAQVFGQGTDSRCWSRQPRPGSNAMLVIFFRPRVRVAHIVTKLWFELIGAPPRLPLRLDTRCIASLRMRAEAAGSRVRLGRVDDELAINIQLKRTEFVGPHAHGLLAALWRPALSSVHAQSWTPRPRHPSAAHSKSGACAPQAPDLVVFIQNWSSSLSNILFQSCCYLHRYIQPHQTLDSSNVLDRNILEWREWLLRTTHNVVKARVITQPLVHLLWCTSYTVGVMF